MLLVITLSAPALTLWVAPFLPILVAFFTKRHAHPAVKAGVLAVLAVVSALVTAAIQNGSSIDLDKGFAQRLLVTGIVAVAAHYGLLRPAAVTGADGVVARKVEGGLG